MGSWSRQARLLPSSARRSQPIGKLVQLPGTVFRARSLCRRRGCFCPFTPDCDGTSPRNRDRCLPGRAGAKVGNRLRLMGKKLLVALTMEGKFAGEGLQNIEEDDDIFRAIWAIARTLRLERHRWALRAVRLYRGASQPFCNAQSWLLHRLTFRSRK